MTPRSVGRWTSLDMSTAGFSKTDEKPKNGPKYKKEKEIANQLLGDFSTLASVPRWTCPSPTNGRMSNAAEAP